MKKHLFLTGAPGCGKTALLRGILGGAASMAGGFVTERACAPDGTLLGYDLLPAAAAGGAEGFEPRRFLFCQGEALHTDNEVFRSEGVRLLEEAAWYPFSLLDQFGGFELVIPQFREALAEFLSGEQPCLGVLMSPQAAEDLRRRLGLGEKLTAYVRRLHEALEADPDTLILKTTGSSDQVARRIVEQWVKEFV